MGYDLYARNKELEPYHFGAFSWSWMLQQGIGLILGTGPAMEPASYSWIGDKKGRDPNTSDGFFVTAAQARAMSMAATGLAKTKRFLNTQWEKLTPEEYKNYEKVDIFKKPVREDFIEKVEKFAEWAKKSKGFAIR